MKLIIADVETTGLRTYNSKIVEIGAIVLGPDLAEVERWGSLVNPGKEALGLAQPKAMEMNKLTREELEAAPCTQEAAKGFQALLGRHGDAVFHAYNNEFDSWFLAQPPWGVPEKRWGECIMMASMDIMDAADELVLNERGKPKFPKLSEAMAFFGCKGASSHRAVDDARAAADVYTEILRGHRSRPNDVEFLREAKYMILEGF